MRNHMTPPEQFIWDHRRDITDARIVRQNVMYGYIADFYIPKARAIIEVDGKTHDEKWEWDERRDYVFASRGYGILRLPASVILRFPNIAIDIARDFLDRMTELSRYDRYSTDAKAWAEVIDPNVVRARVDGAVAHYVGNDPDTWHPEK